MAQLKARVGGRDAGRSGSELSDGELEDARRGFEQYLRIKRFPSRFIAEHGDDLMARARFELARAMGRGDQIIDPPAWLINCAYRRAQNFLTSKGRAPDLVGLDSVAEIADESGTVEETTLDRDRQRKVREAVARLTVEERKLVALEFFEGLSLAKSARELGWKESKARLRHASAMKRLHDLLGVESSDQIVIDVAAAAWAAEAFGPTLRVNVVAEVGQRLSDLGQVVFGHTPEPVRRLVWGGASDPTSAAAAGNLARTAGRLCTAALCLYAGAAGVGLAPVPLHGGSGQVAGSQPERNAPADVRPAASSSIPSEGPAESSAGPGNTHRNPAGTSRAGVKQNAQPHASQPLLHQAEVEAEHVFHSFEGAGLGSSALSSGSGVASGTPSAGASSSERQAERAFRSFER